MVHREGNIFAAEEMKKEAVFDYYIYNGKRYRTTQTDGFDKINSPCIYETIRIIDGVPLFLEAHLERLKQSAQLLGKQIVKNEEEITSEILALLQMNRCNNINVKLLCGNLDKEQQDFLVYVIESFYPNASIYKSGIYAVLCNLERENPNAKVMDFEWKSKVKALLKETGAFEALLVNRENCITEGSRSNVFFVQGKKIYTAPAQDVLLGVTRTMILNLCRQLHIEFVEKMVPVQEIPKMDGAFMTGTSVNVLPISKIDGQPLPSVANSIIHQVATEYEKLMWDYVKDRKKHHFSFASCI